jgi:hypothetical protein
MKRRQFLAGSLALGAAAAPLSAQDQVVAADPAGQSSQAPEPTRGFNDAYRGEHLEQIAFPLGGIAAGMFCIEGNGATATGYGTVGIRNGEPFLQVTSGKIPYTRIHYIAP